MEVPQSVDLVDDSDRRPSTTQLSLDQFIAIESYRDMWERTFNEIHPARRIDT